MKLEKYKYLIFDCDGVILNSNSIKTNAFGNAVSKFGSSASNELIDFHKERGGITRYEKFKHFYDVISVNNKIEKKNISIDELLENYGKIVKQKLEVCEIENEIINYRPNSEAKWFIVTGSDQEELIEIFKKRKIFQDFEGGIYGGPKSKIDIFEFLIKKNKIETSKSLYIGDSKYDYIAASKFSIDFIFLNRWSEFKDLKNFATKMEVPFFNTFKELLTTR